MTTNGISASEALRLCQLTQLNELGALFDRAEAVRLASFGTTVTACSIINAKCGNCPEDCAFCPQSIHSNASIQEYPLVSAQAMFEAAEQAQCDGSTRFGIVTSGRTIDDPKELSEICTAVNLIRTHLTILPCASLGILERWQLKRLNESGLDRYHHNLETARSYYPSICTTRTYADQIRTVTDAHAEGLSVCSGAIFGMGESNAQRIELLETLRELSVASIPLNFLTPLPGTRMASCNNLTPLECLKIIAIARLMLPQTKIRICGGRPYNLRDFQSWIFRAGADAMMIGGYLTTAGRPVSMDLQLIRDAHLILGSVDP